MRLLLTPLLLALAPQIASAATLDRRGGLVAVEPYGPGIVRITIATNRADLDAPPSPAVIAKPDPRGWTHATQAEGDSFRSAALTVTVAPAPPPHPQTLGERYFVSDLPPVALTLRGPDGRELTRMTGWDKAPHTVNGERTFRVAATFTAPENEHYYGLGQNQEGVLDHRGRTIACRHDYDAPAGETVCVPFLVTNRGYAIVWDNPSSTLVSPGLHGVTRWQSQVGERVSFFVIAGATTDQLYAGYRRLTGETPLPPKAAFGLIQSKARYETAAQLLADAEGYQRRGYPLDVMVLDWFYWTKMGELDIDRAAFPDPRALNDRLHAMGLRSLVSVWPRFERGSRYFDMLAAKGWLLHDKDGSPVDGLPVRADKAGALIDTTRPDAARWFWERIRDNLAAQGFDWFWLDETEPDLVPDGHWFAIGSGDRYHNIYPLTHLSAVADGSARDRPGMRNLILARAAWLGAQRTGALFWSSDVAPGWDALRRQVPAGINASASGLAYWSSDTGGWQWPGAHMPAGPPLLDPAGAAAMGSDFPDYPELFVRWFQYNAFTPTLRIHGQRPETALWTYGAAAEPILARYLRLRYALIPYLYALGRQTFDTGAPLMRGLFMDFPSDPAVQGIGDQYMLGPAFLVAPVTEQGATSRRLYLPAGADWYDWWTERRFAGGQWITADAPIDRLPLFVRAGSIVPLGVQVPSTATRQPLAEIRVFPGADATFALFDDDGVSNGYRNGAGRRATLRWDDRTRRLTADGALPTGQPLAGLVRIVGAPARR